MLEQTSPRTLSGLMNARGCTAVIPMTNQTHAVFNGTAWSSSEVGLLRGEISLDLREPAPNTFAVIRFSSDVRNRGWEQSEGQLHLHYATGDRLSRLQHVIRRALALSCTSMHDRQFAFVAESLCDELMNALDDVLILRNDRHSGQRAYERHRKLVSKLDEFARAHPELPLYSEALAKELGTSVRTLQLAVQAIHGASLHQHLRNKRLWSLRAQLAKGLPATSVSAAALANGFSHMGELSQLYKITFGELPSETLLRSRGA